MSEAFTKAALRQIFKARREQLDSSVRCTADSAIVSTLCSLPEIAEKGTILGYMTEGTEPNLQPFFAFHAKRGGQLFFPRSTLNSYEMAEADPSDDGWTTGAYGLREPDRSRPTLPETERKQGAVVWLIPGVAFTQNGVRLGRGKSVYDRLTADSAGLRIGIFYECQESDQIPEASHDQRLDLIVTEKRVLRLPRTARTQSINRNQEI